MFPVVVFEKRLLKFQPSPFERKYVLRSWHKKRFFGIEIPPPPREQVFCESGIKNNSSASKSLHPLGKTAFTKGFPGKDRRVRDELFEGNSFIKNEFQGWGPILLKKRFAVSFACKTSFRVEHSLECRAPDPFEKNYKVLGNKVFQLSTASEK